MIDLYKKRICLYGMGAYGIRMFFFLQDRNIDIWCFGDNDNKKHGRTFGGVHCISYKEVFELPREDTCIIVCMKESETVVHDFKMRGFTYVYKMMDAEMELSNLPARNPEIWVDYNEVYKIKNEIEECYLRYHHI